MTEDEKAQLAGAIRVLQARDQLERTKLCLAEAMGALNRIAETDDAYVCRALAEAAIYDMAAIAKTGQVPSEEETKAYLRSRGYVSGVTRSGGN